MILSTFENENRTANVCKQSGEYVTMLYQDSNYIRTELALTEDDAEGIAENWVFNEIKN
jgi:hypothetical protein